MFNCTCSLPLSHGSPSLPLPYATPTGSSAGFQHLTPHLIPHPQARQLDEDELRPKNGKRLRVHHTINIASKMPRSFNVQTQGEAKVLEYVQVGVGGCVAGMTGGQMGEAACFSFGCCNFFSVSCEVDIYLDPHRTAELQAHL